MRALIAATLAVLLGACSSPPAASPTAAGLLTAPPSSEASFGPSPSPSVSPSILPSAAPAATQAIGTLDVYPPGAAVEVAVKELNLRRNPSTSAKRVAILNRGDVLVVSPNDNISFGFGPVSKNGYTWYPVMVTGYKNGTLPALPASPVTPTGGATGPPISGWVAANDGETPYLSPLAPRCPAVVDLANVQGMLAAERLACFGEPITLTGTYGCPGCGGAIVGTYKPVWLATPVEFDFLSVNPADRIGPLAVRFAPDGPARPAAGTRVSVIVHVDDSRSTKCMMIDGEGASATTIDKRTAVLYCRERLVVEQVQSMGPDPSFPA